MKRLTVLLLGIFVVLPLYGQSQGIAFRRASHLVRGINLSMWYAQAPEYTTERLSTYMTVRDFRLLKSLGFDHARLSVNPEPLMQSGKSDAFDPAAIARLDKTVAEITSSGLTVILDIHPDLPYMDALGHGDASVDALLAFWKSFAAHYAGTDPNKVYFEVLNEPHFDDGYRWAGIQASLIQAMRVVAPKHTIIATGAKWGGVEGLMALEPVRDDNVIYSFHDYDPMIFTHQGATWSSEYLKTLRGVPYPSTPENVDSLADAEVDEEAKKQLRKYGAERWDASRIAKEISSIADWGSRHRVPVWCGEFGVYKAHADPKARAAWVHDMHVALEAHKIGWAMWDYQGGFALVSKADGKTIVVKEVAQALGLHAPAR